jgi:DNA-binding transcriptional LysR family regulator
MRAPPRKSGFSSAIQYLGGIAAVRSRVLEGAGVAVLPLFFVRRDLASGRLTRLMPQTKLPRDWLRMVWRRGQVQETRIRELAAELSERPLR